MSQTSFLFLWCVVVAPAAAAAKEIYILKTIKLTARINIGKVQKKKKCKGTGGKLFSAAFV